WRADSTARKAASSVGKLLDEHSQPIEPDTAPSPVASSTIKIIPWIADRPSSLFNSTISTMARLYPRQDTGDLSGTITNPADPTARARKQKAGAGNADDVTLDASGEDAHQKGIYPSTSSHAGAGMGGAPGLGGAGFGMMNGGVKHNGGSGNGNTIVPIPLKGLGVDSSEQSSYYSQSTGRKPVQPGSGYEHARRPTADSYDSRSNFDSPKDGNDSAPPRSAGAGSINNGQAAPRSGSAQAITRPYVVGSHPYYRTSNAQSSSTENLGYTSTNNNVPYSNNNAS
ncbi:3266_t:CDS:2, partial [Acaulospora colombiana]